MADIGIPALLGALGIIGAGVWKNFFSTGAKRNKIRKMEDEMSKLIKNPGSGNRSRIIRLQNSLAKLQNDIRDKAN